MTIEAVSQKRRDYVSVSVAGQLFGLPIERVRQVFRPAEVTPVPLAPASVEGLINLRGRVLTAIDLRTRLGLPRATSADRMAAGLDAGAEAYGLLVDEIGDVLPLDPAAITDAAAHVPDAWRSLSAGVHRLADRLVVVLDVDAVLDLSQAT